jgi:hypothetical protein
MTKKIQENEKKKFSGNLSDHILTVLTGLFRNLFYYLLAGPGRGADWNPEAFS